MCFLLLVPGLGSRVSGLRRRVGFTLLEVLVAVAVLAVIMVLLWSSTGQSLKAKDRFEARDLVYHQGRVALRKLTDDLTMAFLTKPPAAAAGVAPSTKPLATFFIGEDSGEQDHVRFTAFSHVRFFRDAKESDICKVSYELAPSEEGAGLYSLMRREQPWLDAETELAEGRSYVLAENIRSFDVEYYDDRKDDWSKEWDTQKVDWREKLPMSVRVTIVFDHPDPDREDEPITMSTAVLIPMSSGPIEL